MKNTVRLYLTGFMTSGKSTVGPIVANVLGWDFYDLDHEIVKREGKSVNSIFQENGADYFRNIEREMLTELSSKENTVIALGGGAICNEHNLNLTKSTGKIIYLYISPEIIYKRIKNKLDRPVFYDLVEREASKEEFLERINKLLTEREVYYSQADLKFDTSKQYIGITVDKIVQLLKRNDFEKD